MKFTKEIRQNRSVDYAVQYTVYGFANNRPDDHDTFPRSKNLSLSNCNMNAFLHIQRGLNSVINEQRND
jgi:hypothetical protein